MSSDKDDAAVEGQVSEVSGMSGTPDAISPGDATAGAPDGESGRPEAGEAGPDAIPADNIKANEV
ncbi:MAG: hypothetical protein JWN68_2040 [Nocardioides sp.]|jgi:hypothetical protein|uniref:hypothetical protein n=1 Tax=Nocardioides sp. TaxID=35761 RepID=UPI00262C6664|nr:hypothetical protein [Nocardioides sp.]MCW2834087.1 hypothetical protein [Nocardioides sp.]